MHGRTHIIIADSGAWLKHGNLTDNMVDFGDRMAIRQNQFQPPYDQYLLVHDAKTEQNFMSNFGSLDFSKHLAADDAIPGPFSVLLEGIYTKVFEGKG